MTAAAIEHWPATWAEFEALGEDVRAEYVDGEVVLMDAPTLGHQEVAVRLHELLRDALPEGFGVVLAWGWKPGVDLFIPDLMVYRRSEVTSDKRFTAVPALVVEITSSNWTNDYVVKLRKYAAAGLEHYWIVNPAGAYLDVLTRDEQGQLDVAQQVFDQPTDISFGVATVRVDLPALLA